jgi:hypothetical protein
LLVLPNKGTLDVRKEKFVSLYILQDSEKGSRFVTHYGIGVCPFDVPETTDLKK